MVEANNSNGDFKKGLDIKLSLDLSKQGKSPVVKRVLPSDFDTLLNQAKKLAGRHGLSEEGCQLKYYDGESFVIVEDNDDLELAFAIAQTSSMKLTFTIKHPDSGSVEKSAFDATDAADEEMKDESAAAAVG